MQTNRKSDTSTFNFKAPQTVTTYNINCFALDTVNGLGIADETRVRFDFFFAGRLLLNSDMFFYIQVFFKKKCYIKKSLHLFWYKNNLGIIYIYIVFKLKSSVKQRSKLHVLLL